MNLLSSPSLKKFNANCHRKQFVNLRYGSDIISKLLLFLYKCRELRVEVKLASNLNKAKKIPTGVFDKNAYDDILLDSF